jgi:hypothetical protein
MSGVEKRYSVVKSWGWYRDQLPDPFKGLRARADILPFALAPPHAMSHVVGRWVAGITAAVHTISPLPRVRASCLGMPCPFLVPLACACPFAPCP